MAIPDDVEDKLDSNSNWTVQHKDIVEVIDETSKSKPWSRYMIQQHLESDPDKTTVNNRLDELVELDVLQRYEYSNQSLYDLGYDPIVTDGGRLKDASWIELATLQDRRSARDLATGALLISLVFFGYGIVAATTTISTSLEISGNFYIDVGIMVYIFAFVLLLIVGVVKKAEAWVSSQNWI